MLFSLSLFRYVLETQKLSNHSLSLSESSQHDENEREWKFFSLKDFLFAKKKEKHLKEISLVYAVKINGTFFGFALELLEGKLRKEHKNKFVVILIKKID